MENNLKRLNIIYIDSLAHSGSTLLDMLISGNSNVFSTGEFKLGNKKTMNKPCTCGSRNIYECPFWSQVNRFLKERYSLSLDTIEINSDNRKIFRAHNYKIFKIIQEISGKPYTLESSKNLTRCLRLLREKDLFHVYPIFLKRKLPGIVNSYKKKKLYSTWKIFFLYNLFCLNHFKYRNYAIKFVKYEKLAKDPEKILKNLMKALNLDLEEGQFQWDPKTRHNIGGNRTRRIRNNDIAFDDSWKTGLNFIEAILSTFFDFPGTLLYNLANRSKIHGSFGFNIFV
jgi:hypothetical protein